VSTNQHIDEARFSGLPRCRVRRRFFPADLRSRPGYPWDCAIGPFAGSPGASVRFVRDRAARRAADVPKAEKERAGPSPGEPGRGAPGPGLVETAVPLWADACSREVAPVEVVRDVRPERLASMRKHMTSDDAADSVPLKREAAFGVVALKGSPTLFVAAADTHR
jgi:hypothetical protein